MTRAIIWLHLYHRRHAPSPPIRPLLKFPASFLLDFPGSHPCITQRQIPDAGVLEASSSSDELAPLWNETGTTDETQSNESQFFDLRLVDRFRSNSIDERVARPVRLVLAKPAASRQLSQCRCRLGFGHRHRGGRRRDDSPDDRWRCHLDAADKRDDECSQCG